MPPPSAIAFASRCRARPDAYCSRHPFWPQPHGQAVADEAGVPELAGDAVTAAEQLAADDDGAADAGAHRQHDHVVDVAPGAEAELGPAGRVRVVLDGDGHVDARLERRLQRFVAPRDVGGVDDGGPVAVDESGRRDSDGGDLVAGAEVTRHVDDGIRELAGVDAECPPGASRRCARRRRRRLPRSSSRRCRSRP